MFRRTTCSRRTSLRVARECSAHLHQCSDDVWVTAARCVQYTYMFINQTTPELKRSLLAPYSFQSRVYLLLADSFFQQILCRLAFICAERFFSGELLFLVKSEYLDYVTDNDE